MTEEVLDLLNACLGNRYEVIEEIAPADRANRFLARDLTRGCDVSINVLNRNNSDWADADRFLQELIPYAGVDHPQLTTVVDGGVFAGRAFWVSLRPHGELLDHRLRRHRPLPTDAAVEIALDLTVPVGYLHDYGLVHGSLTLDSILLLESQTLVADAGVMRAMNLRHRDCDSGIAMFSPFNWDLPDWPEQDHRSDIYSLGAMLYEMISAKSPWLESHIVRPGTSFPPLPSRVPEPLRSTIYKALANNPDERFSEISEFRTALFGSAD